MKRRRTRWTFQLCEIYRLLGWTIFTGQFTMATPWRFIRRRSCSSIRVASHQAGLGIDSAYCDRSGGAVVAVLVSS
ncbi:hypothetical protein Ae201684_014815 [Aphanomyces euteiches]|uniref:Uncharacterized protein n=1 Tax=Aphanomyces euteiches TaxID=100861 RepID=A0A6G0WIN1_9STRA|nr:hypothetical protein Ae201684_014815 [Aphanomyces euteiches]